ncbi:uncharacterized protein [Solanum lycopersicum]|uniref:uncharacterized protein n=1 Tax=Solanum lycopersicum TaxID=4081 RepID=UPI0037483DA5
MVPKSISNPPPKVWRDQSYTLEEAIKFRSSHPHIHHYSSPVEIEKMVKNEEHEEMTKKMKSLEQSIRDMQGLGGHKGISFSDFCMFPYVHLPAGFKTPKFEKYDGHGDPIAHLKRYCNQLRGVEGKEEVLMAYFGEILVGIASEWFIDQDIFNWHTWDDLARCFVQQFQYNIDIVPDRSSLANMRKPITENFREYAIRWREQAARVKPPMKESEMIDVFLEAQEPGYFHYLLSSVGKTFAEVIKVGEMVENGIKSGKIVSQASLEATTQVLQNGSGNIGGKKRREDVAAIVSAPRIHVQGVESVLEKLSPSNTPILIVKGALEDVWAILSRGKINYEPTVVRYKGKEVAEEIEEVGGITRSGKCYVPMELRKTKNDQIQIKSPVTEGEAKEFLRKMKLSDYSVVEQLRKTPAQISLLSLLIHSDEHCKLIVSQLEKIAKLVFKVNRITFSNDELPKEGTGHNQGLHITVKCELLYVTLVLIYGGSGANICPLSTLHKLNVSAERVRPNNVCVRAFDGSKTDVIGEIELVLTIGPVDFAVNFQVLDINASYNLLLGRPWVHRDGEVPSTLHQMIKFEYDRQEIIVYGEGDLSIYKHSSFTFIKADNENEALIYQDSEVLVIEKFPEGIVISKTNIPISSVMVVNELLKHAFEPGNGLGICLQGRAYHVSLRKSIGTFGLGYQPRVEDKMMEKKQKRDVWSLTKPIQPIYKSFIKARATESYQESFPQPVMKVREEMINYFQDLFVEVYMVEIGEGTSNRDVQFIGTDVNLNN